MGTLESAMQFTLRGVGGCGGPILHHNSSHVPGNHPSNEPSNHYEEQAKGYVGRLRGTG